MMMYKIKGVLKNGTQDVKVVKAKSRKEIYRDPFSFGFLKILEVTQEQV